LGTDERRGTRTTRPRVLPARACQFVSAFFTAVGSCTPLLLLLLLLRREYIHTNK
jgi:hypothetical protein